VLQRHPQGPRVFVLGRRIHECALGLAVLASLLGSWLSTLVALSLPFAGAGLFGAWLLAKDWRDLFPSKRDTACWSVGIHRLAAARPARTGGGS
jgi:hypothetical protein